MRYNVRQFVTWLVLLQVAFGIRLAAAQWWEARTQARGQTFAFGDSDGYWELARTIAQGEPYQYGEYRVFRTPGYPVLLAPLFWLSGEDEPPVLWARVEGALFGTIAIGLVVLLAWKLFDERTAWIAGLIATFYPGQIASSIFVLSEAPFMPLMIGQLLAWITAARSNCLRGRIGYAIVAGVLMGCAVLVRPSWLLFLPFAAVIGLAFSCEWNRRLPFATCQWSPLTRHLVICGAMSIALCVVMLPWWVRNYYVVGKFVPTSLQVGISLADGWNPEADGGSDLEKPRFSQVAEDWFVHTVRERGAKTTGTTFYSVVVDGYLYDIGEWEVDRGFFFSATAWAKSNPLRAVQLAGIKFLRMWNFVPNASEFGGWKFRMLYAVTYTPLLMCCLAGLWKYRRRGFEIWLLFLPAIYFTLLHMVFVSSIRYQQPAMLAWMILGAGWITSILATQRAAPNAAGEDRA